MHDAHQLKAVEQLEKEWQEELKAEEKEYQEENARRNRLLVALEEGPTTDTVEFKPEEWV